MKISEESLEALLGIITGDLGMSPIRTEPQLADFFDNRAEWEPFGYGFPARDVYVRERLHVFNGVPRMKHFIEKAFQFDSDDEGGADKAASWFSQILLQDGFKLEKAQKRDFMNKGVLVPGRIFFAVVPIATNETTPKNNPFPHSS